MDHERESTTLGIYTLATTSSEMTSFLMGVARIRSVTGHNVESWATAVESKLANVGILTIAMVIAEIHVINSKLFRAGHVPMYIRTLDIMVRKGVKMKVTTELSMNSQNDEMLAFLPLEAESRQITGSNVESWVTKVHAKLHRVDMDNVEETVSGIVLLNRKLQAAQFSVMHHLTMDSMA
jgi:ABC-type anion transport system duplicated permease subunit